MRRTRTLIFIPTYNERENVEAMVAQIFAVGLDADLLVLDDASPDGTGQLLDDLASRHDRMLVIHRTGKRGVGSAHLDGIAWAYDHGYDTLVTLDCDFTHSPADLTRLLDALGTHDLALGSRYLRVGSLREWNPLRKFLTRFGHFLTKHLLKMDYDATGALRAYRLSGIPREVFGMVTSQGYAFFFESLFLLHRNGLTVAELPIDLPSRTYGHSKMSFWEAYRSFKQVVALFLASTMDPAQFRLTQPISGIDPALVDPQGWDSYWERKRDKNSFAYEMLANLYRRLVIRRRLNAAMRRHFRPGARLLHAGCGSGHVDQLLQDRAEITAVDISVPALRMYTQNVPRAHSVVHASIFDLPFEDGAFDGVYNLGVVEHFTEDEVLGILGEARRVLRSDGLVVVFWPHAMATSVWFLKLVHWLLNDVLGKQVRLHPPELTLLRSRSQARSLLRKADLDLVEYRFGPADGFVQVVVVGRRSSIPATAS